MTKYRRLMSPFAAAICIAAVTWTAAPAGAVEDNAVGQAAKSAPSKSPDAKASPSVTKHHAWRRTHIAASRYNHRVSPAGTGPVCSDVWCGRQFVLMIGIGF
jgi:hypothetical protein